MGSTKRPVNELGTARAMSKLWRFASLPLRSAVDKTCNNRPVKIAGRNVPGGRARISAHKSDEVVASIFLLLSLFDKQFKYSLSF